MLLIAIPTLNALLNATSALLILAGYILIRQKQQAAHRACMVMALGTSTAFLISYLIYHYSHGATPFPGQGIVRTVYFTILISHTILAVVVVPIILATFYRAFRADFKQHRRIAKITLPIWFYVSVTGVVVYLMLYQMYPAAKSSDQTVLASPQAVSQVAH